MQLQKHFKIYFVYLFELNASQISDPGQWFGRRLNPTR